MIEQVIYRKPALDDVVAIEHCAARAYAEAMRAIPDLPDVKSGFAAMIEHHEGIVVEVAGKLVGFIFYGPGERRLKLINLGVDPAFSGRGLARGLIEQAEERARQLGCTALSLVTHIDMDATIAFYKHTGWREFRREGNKVFFEKPMGDIS